MNRQADLQRVTRQHARRAEGAGIFWWGLGVAGLWILIGVMA